MQCLCKKAIIGRKDNKVIYAHWVRIMMYILKHDGCTRKECAHALKIPRWPDYWGSNIWSSLLKIGYIETNKHRRPPRYGITDLGIKKLKEIGVVPPCFEHVKFKTPEFPNCTWKGEENLEFINPNGHIYVMVH